MTTKNTTYTSTLLNLSSANESELVNLKLVSTVTKDKQYRKSSLSLANQTIFNIQSFLSLTPPFASKANLTVSTFSPHMHKRLGYLLDSIESFYSRSTDSKRKENAGKLIYLLDMEVFCWNKAKVKNLPFLKARTDNLPTHAVYDVHNQFQAEDLGFKDYQIDIILELLNLPVCSNNILDTARVHLVRKEWRKLKALVSFVQRMFTAKP